MGLTRPRAHQLQDSDFKQSVRAISTSNITLSGGAPSTVDGVSLALNDRVLVTGQTTGSENGIYHVTTVGSGSNGTWARSPDADATGDMTAGMVVMVTEGTSYADTSWKITTDDPITLGTTSITFAQASAHAYGTIAVSGQSSIVADSVGDTLTIAAGNNISLTTNASTDTLTVSATGIPTAISELSNDSGYSTTTGTVTSVAMTVPVGLSVSGTPVTTSGTLAVSLAAGYSIPTTTKQTQWDSAYTLTNALTATSTELNYVDGVTSAIQTQLDTKITASSTDTLTNKTLTSPQVGTDIRLNAQAELEFYDSDSSNYVSFRAPATITSNITWTLPASDGTADQVLATDGAGTLSWADAGSGGGSGSSYPNSTFQTLPGTNGNFDLSYNVAQTSQEIAFEAGGTDAFGVNLGSVFSLMDPVGSVETAAETGLDLGVLT